MEKGDSPSSLFFQFNPEKPFPPGTTNANQGNPPEIRPPPGLSKPQPQQNNDTQGNTFPFFFPNHPPSSGSQNPMNFRQTGFNPPFYQGPSNQQTPMMFPPMPTQPQRVTDLENHMFRHPGTNSQQPTSSNHSNLPFNHFFQPNSQPQMQNSDGTSGLDQMMARMRIMAQRREQEKRQQVNNSPYTINLPPNFNVGPPTPSSFFPPQHMNHFQGHPPQVQSNHHPMDLNANVIEEKQEVYVPEQHVKSPPIVSEPTEDTEIYQPRPSFERKVDPNEEKEKEYDGPYILLPAPPPDKNRTGIYLTNRSKRILGKLPELNLRKENRINQTILKFVESMEAPVEVEMKRKDLVQRLQIFVSDLYPDYHPKLHLFGSSANNFALKIHDVDVCLTIEESAGSKVDVIERLANAMSDDDAEDINPLVWARVPILKFRDRKTGYQCDICVNNILALRNTKLLADYSAIDPRVRILVLVVKYWAKCRKINEPYTGTLSSYAYVLMVIQYLQTREPPILPCLQQLIDPNQEKVLIQGFDCTYNENISNFRNFGRDNRDSPAKLLVGFFRLYGFEFDYIHSVICVRTGGFLSKDIKQWMIPSHPRECCFFGLEDPFDTTHNLGRVVDRPGMDTIRGEFERGYKILVKTGDFDRATQEYTEENPDTRW